MQAQHEALQGNGDSAQTFHGEGIIIDHSTRTEDWGDSMPRRVLRSISGSLVWLSFGPCCDAPNVLLVIHNNDDESTVYRRLQDCSSHLLMSPTKMKGKVVFEYLLWQQGNGTTVLVD